MIEKAAISSTLAILTTCTVELVSPQKRKICAFSTIVYARVFLLAAPFIGATIEFGQLVPQTAFSTLALIGGLLSLLISSPPTIPRTTTTTTKHLNLPKELPREIYTIKNFDDLSLGEKYKTMGN